MTNLLALFPGDRGPSGRARHRYRKLTDKAQVKLFASLERAVEQRQQQRRAELVLSPDNQEGSVDDENPFLGFSNFPTMQILKVYLLLIQSQQVASC